jgi:O-antigen ligase
LPRFGRNAPPGLKILVVLSLLLPLLQSIPLPPTLWSTAPGRDLVVQSFEAAGISGWTSLSVDPHRTLLALSALVTPLAVLIIGWSCRQADLISLGWLVVALALANFLLGSVQVLTLGELGSLYDTFLAGGVMNGTFANRNSTGLFLVGALGLAALLPPPRLHPVVLPARIALCALLLVGIVLTRSRTSLVLAAIPILLTALRVFWWSSRNVPSERRARRVLLAGGVVGLGAALAAAGLALVPGRVADTVERFQALGDDARFYIWEDGAYAASRYWPLGAGVGTFDDVFQVDESLENMTKRRAGRAHSDYLELAIEAGLPGLLIVTAWLAFLAWLAWRVRLSRLRWFAWANAAFLLVIALQSITDYPLRNQALLAVAGFALLGLARVGAAPSGESR